jgi:hypothetical protein
LSLPVALFVMFIMLIMMPIKYIITGRYNYDNDCIRNWFSCLGLIK